jgi:hypothetical protein
MPFMMGMGLGVNWTAAAVVGAMPSLMGHLIYGGLLGFVFGRLVRTPALGDGGRLPQRA